MSVDSFAGPSEILILADQSANPAYVAADMVSQAEHDEMAGSILITDSRELAEQVREQLWIGLLPMARRMIFPIR